jgi:hypothetical protein
MVLLSCVCTAFFQHSQIITSADVCGAGGVPFPLSPFAEIVYLQKVSPVSRFSTKAAFLPDIFML